MLVDIENTSSTSGYLLLCFSAGRVSAPSSPSAGVWCAAFPLEVLKLELEEPSPDCCPSQLQAGLIQQHPLRGFVQPTLERPKCGVVSCVPGESMLPPSTSPRSSLEAGWPCSSLVSAVQGLRAAVGGEAPPPAPDLPLPAPPLGAKNLSWCSAFSSPVL